MKMHVFGGNDGEHRGFEWLVSSNQYQGSMLVGSAYQEFKEI